MSARTPASVAAARCRVAPARAPTPGLSRRGLPGAARRAHTDPHTLAAPDAPIPADPLSDEDLQLALYLCYELHYRGLPGVSDEWEWEPSLLALRRQLEARFEAGLLDALGAPEGDVAAEDMDVALRAVEAADEAPSLSRHLERHGTHAEMLEFVVHRSAYQLKEADPHSWALPRLTGAPKAAMVEIQADEYGGGDAERMHAALFAKSMDRLGLDSRYGAYLDRIPGVTLATVNLMSLLGLHRRWRGALVGHLALFEMSSSVPNRRYGNGLRRLGADRETTDFFDEHVTADAVHESDRRGRPRRRPRAPGPGAGGRRDLGRAGAGRARGPLRPPPARRVGATAAPRCWSDSSPPDR